MAKGRVAFTEKPNCSLMILEAILRIGLGNDQNATGFIRQNDIVSWMLQNIGLLIVLRWFAKSLNGLKITGNLVLFGYFYVYFAKRVRKVSRNARFHKVFLSTVAHSPNVV